MQPIFLEDVKFDDKGLVPAVIQDEHGGRVLMVGYMNREALTKTLNTGRVHFWSRSRKRLWVKGEHSGHIQEVVEVRLDCDGDAILVRVKQKVGCCHEGYRSCFFRRWDGMGWKVCEERVFDPKEIYIS
jgi:phosphoribosyl-AMP cyclohydrolase